MRAALPRCSYVAARGIEAKPAATGARRAPVAADVADSPTRSGTAARGSPQKNVWSYYNATYYNATFFPHCPIAIITAMLKKKNEPTLSVSIMSFISKNAKMTTVESKAAIKIARIFSSVSW